MLVYVQNKDGKPLMPTTRCGKVRRLLKTGKAVVVEQVPFTIRLCYDTTNYVQPVTLGVDTGTKHIGLSATSSKNELYSAEVELRYDISELLATRSVARRDRRLRNTRYRKKRCKNRKRLEIPPSVKHKVDSHIKFIYDVFYILPISKIIIEVASFDIQKMKNPNISDAEYQYGDQFGFWNVREYVLSRDGHVCQYCHGKSGDKILNVHHIESRKTGGNSPGNLITLCETCHKMYHRGDISLNVKRGEVLRDASQMGVIKWRLYWSLKNKFQNTFMTYGYITKYNRIKAGVKKTHYSDSFFISQNLESNQLPYYYKIIQTRRHNRMIHRFKILKGGVKKVNQIDFEVFGFRLYDRVEKDGRIMFVSGRRGYGKFRIRDIFNKEKHDSTYKKLKLKRCKRNMVQVLLKTCDL